MLNLEAIDREIKSLEKLQIRLVTAIRNAPKGSIYFRRGAKEDYVPYCSRGADPEGKRHKLDPADPQDAILIRKLKDKRFAKHVLPRVKQNLRALRAARNYQPISTGFLKEPGVPYEDCTHRVVRKTAENDEFEMLPERQNDAFPENLNIQDRLGVFRSKNELIGARVLDEFRVQFKYEAPLYTPYGVKYPDFTVLHPHTGRIIYIEIAGRMDDPEYRQDLYRKLEAYAEVGIYPGVNLLLICEEPGKGLDVTRIRDLIKGFFGL